MMNQITSSTSNIKSTIIGVRYYKLSELVWGYTRDEILDGEMKWQSKSSKEVHWKKMNPYRSKKKLETTGKVIS